MMTKKKINIDIVSDINCPWCFIGDARLEKALAEAGDQYEVNISYKPFELSPDAPAEGEKKQDYFIRNYGQGALDRIGESNARLAEMGRKEGAIFNFEKSEVIHNTFNGHRLIWLAGKYGVQHEVALALFKANFTDGKDVNDVEVLKQIGVEHSIPAEKLESFFNSDEGKKEVEELEAWARKSGITGVPTFIFNNKYSVSGAQPAETFLEIFKELEPELEQIKSDGDSCGVDGIC